MVLSLYAKGLTTREISAHFAEIYGRSSRGLSLETTRPLWCVVNDVLPGVTAKP
jgi:Transposase, Mutator family